MRFYAHSLARPKRVAKALRKELASVDVAASLPACQDAVAEMYGYAHWREMAADIGRHTPSVEDAAVDAAAVAVRRGRHVETLVKRFSGLASRRSLAEKIVDAITPTGSFVDNTRSAMIRAECHFSDFSATVKFDAVSWFETASDDELVDWIDDQSAGFSYKSGTISWKLRNFPGYGPLETYEERAEAMANAAELSRSADGQIITSDVRVHIPDAMRWLREHRPKSLKEVEAAVKGHQLNIGSDYVPSWDSDPRWPGSYCTLAEEARRERDAKLRTFVPRERVPDVLTDFLRAEWDCGVRRIAVLPEGPRHIIVRDWPGGKRDVSSLDDAGTAAAKAGIAFHNGEEDVRRMLNAGLKPVLASSHLHFQRDESEEWWGRHRALAKIACPEEGCIFVDFSEGAVKIPTLEQLGIFDMAPVDRALARTNGLIVVTGARSDLVWEKTRRHSLMTHWLETTSTEKATEKQVARILSRRKLYDQVIGPDFLMGEMMGWTDLPTVLACAALCPVVITDERCGTTLTQAFDRLREYCIDANVDPSRLSQHLAGIIVQRFEECPETETDRRLARIHPRWRRRSLHRVVTEYAMFASAEEVEAFTARFREFGSLRP